MLLFFIDTKTIELMTGTGICAVRAE